MQQLIFCSLYPTLCFNPKEGTFFKINSNNQIVRQVFPQEDGRLYVPKADNKNHTYKKTSVLAWEFLNNKELPKNFFVFHKNLDTSDFSAYNLIALPKDEYKKLMDAILNLDGILKLIPNEKNPYGCLLRYKLNGKTMYKAFEDIVTAKKAKRAMLINSTKYLHRYTLSE